LKTNSKFKIKLIKPNMKSMRISKI